MRVSEKLSYLFHRQELFLLPVTQESNPLDRASTTVLYIIVALLPIGWLPGVHPRILSNLTKVLLIIFIMMQLAIMIIDVNIAIPWPSLVVISAIIGLGVIVYGYLTRGLIIVFGVASVFYFHRNQETTKQIFRFFTIWIALLSAYSLMITFTPLSGFELSGPFYPEYTSPVDRWPGPFIEQNSFGFYSGRGVYTLTSTGLIFAVIYTWRQKSKFYFLSGLIMCLQLINIYWLTGSGRAGFVLPVFLIIILAIKTFSLEKMIPVIVFSPIITWIVAFIFKDVSVIESYLIILNDFTSERVALYLDSIAVLTSNSQSVIGWGPLAWGQYSLADLGIKSSIGSYGQTLTRPHNFALRFFIEYGIVLGGLLMYICWNISRKAVQQIQRSTPPTYMAVVIFLIGWIFVGMAVGGKLGPYPVSDSVMILWWLGYGSFIPLTVPQDQTF